MKFLNKRTLVNAMFVVGLVSVGAIVAPHADQSTAQTNAKCPAGSYYIGLEKNGQPICKLEPTGCPYGDSIPLDSPKCAPPPVQKPAPEPAPKQPPKATPVPKPTRNCEE